MSESNKTLPNEAKVIAEESIKPTSDQEESVSKSEQSPAKKKRNPALIIILVLFGFAVICCSCTVGGIFALNYTIQNNEQATSVKGLFEALSTGDKEKVQELSSQTLYMDLYEPMDDGSTLADLFKDNLDEVKMTSFTVNDNDATVKYTLKVKRNPEAFTKVTYAELSKVGESWIVTYFGPESGLATPTPTLGTDTLQ